MAQAYKRITTEEIESVLCEFGEFERVKVSNSREDVYHIPTSDENIEIRVYSSLVNGRVRDAGSDSIKVVPWNAVADRPLGKTKRTHRIKTWKQNFIPKVEDLLARVEAGEWSEVSERAKENAENPECPDCGRSMCIREGKYGEFYGCPAFPQCRGTMSVQEWKDIQAGEFVWNERTAFEIADELEEDDLITVTYEKKNKNGHKDVELEVVATQEGKISGRRVEDGHFMILKPEGLFTVGSHFPFVGKIEGIE